MASSAWQVICKRRLGEEGKRMTYAEWRTLLTITGMKQQNTQWETGRKKRQKYLVIPKKIVHGEHYYKVTVFRAISICSLHFDSRYQEPSCLFLWRKNKFQYELSDPQAIKLSLTSFLHFCRTCLRDVAQQTVWWLLKDNLLFCYQISIAYAYVFLYFFDTNVRVESDHN